jgi:hypothetical protein
MSRHSQARHLLAWAVGIVFLAVCGVIVAPHLSASKVPGWKECAVHDPLGVLAGEAWRLIDRDTSCWCSEEPPKHNYVWECVDE